MIASVHSFAQSSIGTYFVGFLAPPRGVRGDARPLALARAARHQPPSLRLRKAAVASGWLVIVGVRSRARGHLAASPLPVGWRVMLIALVAGAAVFVALEIVFRRMTHGLELHARRPADRVGPLARVHLPPEQLGALSASSSSSSSRRRSRSSARRSRARRSRSGRPSTRRGCSRSACCSSSSWASARSSAGRRRAPTRCGGRSASRSRRSAAAAVAPLRARARRSASRRSSGATPIYPGALGAALRGFNAFTPVLGSRSARSTPRSSCRSSCCSSARARRRARASRRPAILWWLGGVPGLRLHARHAAAASRGAGTAGTSSTSASCSCSSASPASRGTSTTRPRSCRARATQVDDYKLELRRRAHGGRQQQAHDLRRRGRLRRTASTRARLSPAKFIYKKQPDSPTTEVAIWPPAPRRRLRHRRHDQPADQASPRSRST